MWVENIQIEAQKGKKMKYIHGNKIDISIKL